MSVLRSQVITTAHKWQENMLFNVEVLQLRNLNHNDFSICATTNALIF